MDGVFVLDIKFNFGYGDDVIHPVILKDDKDMILVDCGYSDSLKLIEKSSLEKGIDISKLTKVIITHHDHDHIGGLYEIKNKYPNIIVISSKIDSPYIDGTKSSLRIKQAEEIQKSLPLDKRDDGSKFIDILRSIKNVNVDFLVEDKEIFDWCGGCEIIGTPGHMPGHISLYLNKFKTLIAGDALIIKNGNIDIANPEYNLDMQNTKNSILKLLDYDIDKIICYHGGIYKGDIGISLNKILNSY